MHFHGFVSVDPLMMSERGWKALLDSVCRALGAEPRTQIYD